MTKKNAIPLDKTRRTLYLILVFSAIITIVLLGCYKEKATESKGAGPVTESKGTVPCEVYDKLPGDIAKSAEVNYGNKIKLVGITVNKISRNQLEISYYWQLLDVLDQYKQVFVHFTDATNYKILFQGDHLFCQNHSIEEIKGKFIKETHVVNIPQSAMGKKVNIMIGVYAPELKSAPRLKVESTAGVPVIGNAATFEKFSL